MHSDVDEVPGDGREARIFDRVPVRAFSGLEVEVGPLGKAPAHGKPMNINWSKLTDFATTAEGWKTDFWIGYTF